MEEIVLLFLLSWGISTVLCSLIKKFVKSHKPEKLAITKAVFLTPTLAIAHGVAPVPVCYPIIFFSKFSGDAIYANAFLICVAFLFFLFIEKKS